MLVEDIINEKYINAVGFDDRATSIKKKYQDQVWDLLQKSYANIGGIKGDGFSSPDEMRDFPMWKIAVRDDTVRAVIIYRDKNGRKSVAMGTDGTDAGMQFINDILKNEIKRSYGEKSKAVLGKMLKLVPWDILKNYVTAPSQVAQMMPDRDITPINDVPENEWPADAALTLKKFPQLLDYGYLRDIGGSQVFKIMIGTPGKTIK